MKNSSNLEAFKLDKVQMNAIAGGAGRDKVLCQTFDDEGFEDILTVPDGMISDQHKNHLIMLMAAFTTFSVTTYIMSYNLLPTLFNK